MNDNKARQQIVDKIKSSSNILVTVSNSPSVDALSAALGLTILLNKLDKHATAVFSGGIPPAITFLDPQKTFENTVDSLRDFIIALDKEKADHLRYKVDGDVVKIFITPYRTTIGADDLEFSQGDYNVELVLALGVETQDHLDEALAAHGRILHDATVATISVDQKSELGSIDWTDNSASSLSEMIATLADGLKKDKSVLDEQISTAFMTGIVAATDRFSNDRTTSHVMTIAAQLMGAGANQQLIAAELEQASEIGAQTKPTNADGTKSLDEDKSTKLEKTKEEAPAEKPRPNGELVISHEKQGDIDEVARETAAEHQREAAKKAEEALARETAKPHEAEEKLAEELKTIAPAAAATKPSVADLQKDLAEANDELNEAANEPAQVASNPAPAPTSAPAPNDSLVSNVIGENKWHGGDHEPLMGGTLNATSEQAASDARKAEEADRNKTILSHGGHYVNDAQPAFQSPINAAAQPEPELPGIDMFKDSAPEMGESRAPTIEPVAGPLPPAPELDFEAAPVPMSTPSQTLADLDRANRGLEPQFSDAPLQDNAAEHDEARAAIQNALDAAPAAPAVAPEFPPLPPAPVPAGAVDFTPGMPAPAPISAPPAAPQPLAGLPPLPPLPDFSTLPPLPPPAMGEAAAPAPAPMATLPPDEKLGDMLTPVAPSQQSAPEVPNDPAQYRIPGQP